MPGASAFTPFQLPPVLVGLATHKGEIDLDSLLDSVATKNGAKPKEDPGLARLRQREAEEDAAAKKKLAEVLAAEKAGKDLSFAGETKEAANAGIAAANALFNR